MKTMHDNSLACFDEEAPTFATRAHAIHQLLVGVGVPLTDRDVMQRLGFHEPNSVRPRITELILKGWADEAGSVRCPVTGKTVRLVRGRNTKRPVEPGQLELFAA